MEMMQSMRAGGYEVLAMAFDDDEAFRARLQAEGIQFELAVSTRTGMNPLSELRLFFSLWALFRRVKPHGVFLYTIKPLLWGGLAAWLAGVPRRVLMVSGLGYLFEARSFAVRLAKACVAPFYKRALATATQVVFQNFEDREELLKHGLLEKERSFLRVHGSGVDLQRFSALPMPAEATTFLFCSRLLREKGVEDFVRAGSILRARGLAPRLLLAGPVDSNPGSITRETLDGWVARGEVEYRGFVGDVRPLLAESQVFVLPTYYREGVPRSLLEAIASARPVITTDRPGCRETLRPGVSGLIVAARAPEALAEAMSWYMEHPAELRAHGLAARGLAEENFDVRRVNAAILETLA